MRNKILTWIITLISAIVGALVGAAITAKVTISIYHLEKENRDSDMRNNLNMLIFELNQNQKYVQEMSNTYKMMVETMKKKKFGQSDYSLLMYTPYFEYEKTAFDIAKGSGAIQLIKDIKLRSKLMNIYRNLEIRKQDTEQKVEVKRKLFIENSKGSKQNINEFIRILNIVINYEDMAKHFNELNDSIDSILYEFPTKIKKQ